MGFASFLEGKPTSARLLFPRDVLVFFSRRDALCLERMFSRPCERDKRSVERLEAARARAECVERRRFFFAFLLASDERRREAAPPLFSSQTGALETALRLRRLAERLCARPRSTRGDEENERATAQERVNKHRKLFF